MTMDRMSAAPKEERPEPEVSQKQIAKSNDIYLKPANTIFPSPNPKTHVTETFNEKFREKYNFAKEYVNFIAENVELNGETIEIWTRPYGGLPAEFWKVPVNKPVWGPRYLAEAIKARSYHRLMMGNPYATEQSGMGTIYNTITVDKTIQRLDAQPVTKRKSIFMGAQSF